MRSAKAEGKKNRQRLSQRLGETRTIKCLFLWKAKCQGSAVEEFAPKATSIGGKDFVNLIFRKIPLAFRRYTAKWLTGCAELVNDLLELGTYELMNEL